MTQSIMLVKVSANANNNKFYEVTLDDSGLVTKRWGRVGTDGTSASEHSGESGFNRIVRSKKSRGYKEVNTVSHTSPKGVQNKELSNIAQKALLSDPSSDNPKVLDLVNRIVQSNQHQIMESSGGMIKVDDDGVLKTPLGIIDQSNIEEARKILVDLKDASVTQKSYVSKLEEYLTLVPQKVAARGGWHEDFLKDNRYGQQMDFLEQLEKSYEWYQKTLKAAEDKPTKENDSDYSDLFRYKLSPMEDDKVLRKIKKYFQDSSNSRHSSSGFTLANVYQLQNEVDFENFSQAKSNLGNVKELWHGTNVANVLSILSKGLFVPPTSGSSIRVTGRMFGNGVYFSNQSTKSLNYSTGFWGGGRSAKSYMFLADVVLGKEFHPTSYGPQTAARKSHDSIFVNPRTAGVLNNEVIVWNTHQIMLKYLCEFSN